MTKLTQAQCDALMERGWELLRGHSAPEALKLGRRLEASRFSGGFELQALALNDLNRRREAIAVLERGVAIVPDIWLLWQLLGNYRSDEGDFDSAFEAYERAAACEADQVSVAYNYANALARAGRREEAKRRLQPLIDNEVPGQVDEELGARIAGLYGDIVRRERREGKAETLLARFSAVVARAFLGRRST